VEEIERRIEQVVEELGREGVAGLGVGVPGAVRPDGLVIRSPNIPAWRDYPARTRLGRRLGLPVSVENDANVAALAEGWLGAGRGIADYLVLTLGTGIGSGIVLGGRLWRGDGGRAGELGHIAVDAEGAPCGCGARGCVEAYASAPALLRLARDQGLEGDLPELVSRAREGNPRAQAIFRTGGRALGTALANWFNLMDVRTVIVGGGAAPALEPMRPALEAVLDGRVYGLRAGDFRILPAELGADAGVIGAAKLALDG
jgi:glucokinase